jgi:putative RNA 2'-phosphotransferase
MLARGERRTTRTKIAFWEAMTFNIKNMDKNELKNRSKFISKVLRHNPEMIDIQLDPQGWVNIDILLAKIAQKGPAYLQPLDRSILAEVVAENDKQRFAISEDGTMIRANQGHSVTIDLGYTAQQPPEQLFHGTAEKNIASIQQSGLNKGERHHVHLSADRETASRVGGRHGVPKVLTIKAGEMHAAGFVFYCYENGVWLTEEVPTHFIGF